MTAPRPAAPTLALSLHDGVPSGRPCRPTGHPALAPAPDHTADLGATVLLARLRAAARQARTAPRINVPVHGCVATEPESAARVIVRTLADVLGARPIFHRPDEASLSFDEAWLVRCSLAQRAGDCDSLAFLVRRRVPVERRRAFLDLLRAAAPSHA